MHYKAHIFTEKPPDPYKISDILKPYKIDEDGRKKSYPQNIIFLWDSYTIGGEYAVWNGAVSKISNLKTFDPSDCFILLSEEGKCVTRDCYFTLPGLKNLFFMREAWEMAVQYKDGYVTIVDISDYL